MNLYVADTHALFWYLTASPALSAAAKAAFRAGEAGQATIYVPAIVLAEFYYLNKKLAQPVNFPATYRHLELAAQFVLLPLLAAEVLDLDRDVAVTEMHDRMVVGVARRTGATLITADRQITASAAVPIIW